MNILKETIDRLNSKLITTNIFDVIYGLCELNSNGIDKAWVSYIGDGQAEVVTDYDSKNGTLFWAKNGKVNVSKSESIKVKSCDLVYQTTFPLSAYAVVKKSYCPCDNAYVEDWIASQIINSISGFDNTFKEQMHLISFEVIPKTYDNENKTLPSNYEYATVVIDFDITFQITNNNPCFNNCL
jgi:hypothetical protein